MHTHTGMTRVTCGAVRGKPRERGDRTHSPRVPGASPEGGLRPRPAWFTSQENGRKSVPAEPRCSLCQASWTEGVLRPVVTVFLGERGESNIVSPPKETSFSSAVFPR